METHLIHCCSSEGLLNAFKPISTGHMLALNNKHGIINSLLLLLLHFFIVIYSYTSLADVEFIKYQGHTQYHDCFSDVLPWNMKCVYQLSIIQAG